ncbi:MAG TPA: hypothetical protein VF245_00530 [Solirubrobacterales bacterium]
MDDLRQANISIVVFVVITAIGVFAFRNSGEAALQLVGVVSFVITFAVFFTLQGRAERREGKDPQ